MSATEGAVYLWTYVESSRSYEGWHLTADAAGCAALLTAIDALATTGSLTTATLPPTPAILSVPSNRRAAVRSASRLTVRVEGDRNAWHLVESGGEITLIVAPDRVHKLRRGIEDVQRGRGDYSIGGDRKRESRGERLWFWWMPRPRRDS